MRRPKSPPTEYLTPQETISPPARVNPMTLLDTNSSPDDPNSPVSEYDIDLESFQEQISSFNRTTLEMMSQFITVELENRGSLEVIEKQIAQLNKKYASELGVVFTYDPEGDVQDWRPFGESGNVGYPKDSIARYEGRVWRSDIERNVWKPGEYGWTELVPEPEEGGEVQVPPYEPTTIYGKDQLALFEGEVWKSVIDSNTWAPSAYPTAWRLQTSDGTPARHVPNTVYTKDEVVSFDGKYFKSTIDNNSWSPRDNPGGWVEVALGEST